MRVYEQEGELFAGVEQNLTSGDGARGILARAPHSLASTANSHVETR